MMMFMMKVTFVVVMLSYATERVCNAMPFLPSWISDIADFHSFEVAFTPNKEEDLTRMRRSAEVKIEDTIRTVIEHLKKEDPRGIPGSLISDPMPVDAEVDQSVAGAEIQLSNMSLTGLCNFDLQNVSVDLAGQEFTYSIFFKSLTALGQHKMSYFWSEYSGAFNITVVAVRAIGRGILEVGDNGTVMLNDVQTDVKFEDIAVEFKNLGGIGWVVQGAVNMIGSFLFDSIKPMTLDKVNEALSENVNVELRRLNEDVLFSDSIPVLDVAVFKARKLIRDNGYDPLNMPEIQRSNTMGIDILLSDGVLTGLSTVYRTGEIAVGMQNYVAKATMALGTQRITGRYHWKVTAFGFIERNGFMRFSVDSLKVRARLAQPLDLSQRPTIEDLDIELGTLTLRSEGAGSLDYAFEMGVNSFPNLFKNIVIDAIERPLMWVIGSQLNDVDVERLVFDNLPTTGVIRATHH